MLLLTDSPTFKYLGLMLPGSVEDVATRAACASRTFGRLNIIWRDRSVIRALKVHLYKSLILTIVIYCSET